MNKCYLLLRNNKESGPYSLAGLLQLSLTANDLIWVEGKSAGWRYPFELDELKEDVVTTSEPPLSTIISSNYQTAGQPLEAARLSPKKVFVSMPLGAKQQPVAAASSFEEKAEAIRQKALCSAKEKEVTEVAYTRSLTDIKEGYTGWRREQKNNQNHSTISKPLAFTILFAAITGVAFFILQWKPQQAKPAEALLLHSKESLPVAKKNANNTFGNKDVEPTTQEVIQEPLQKAGKNVPANRLVVSSPKKQPSLLPQNVKKALPGTLPHETLLNKRETANIPVTDLIQTTSSYTKTKEGIGLSIELYNKGDKNIRVVAIDVMYFDKAKVQIANETLYFSNVQPGGSLLKNSPLKKAASASYRIGLVSAEDAGLYVMQ